MTLPDSLDLDPGSQGKSMNSWCVSFETECKSVYSITQSHKNKQISQVMFYFVQIPVLLFPFHLLFFFSDFLFLGPEFMELENTKKANTLLKCFAWWIILQLGHLSKPSGQTFCFAKSLPLIMMNLFFDYCSNPITWISIACELYHNYKSSDTDRSKTL